MNPITSGIIRHLLTLIGGTLVTQGYLTEGDLLPLVGAVMTLIGFGWSVYAKRTS